MERDRPMYLTTGRIEPGVMNTLPRETARLKHGSAHLINAQVYLSDRAAFQKFMETEAHPGEGFALLNGIHTAEEKTNE